MKLRDLLNCKWMGDELFGKDIDTLFAYHTPRVVRIRDRVLGLTRIFMAICIILYIFIFNIWYKGAHFNFTPVRGIVRLQWQEPTLDHCNPADADCLSDFTDQQDLPYCYGYTGSEPVQVVRDCEFSDSRELPISILDGILMPTRIERYRQSRTCAQYSADCDRKWTFVDSDGTPQGLEGRAEPISSYFIADVEKYTLLIDHNFESEVPWLAFDDFRMQGYWVDCKTDDHTNCVTNKIKCAHSQCKNLHFTKRASLLDIGQSRYQTMMHPEGGTPKWISDIIYQIPQEDSLHNLQHDKESYEDSDTDFSRNLEYNEDNYEGKYAGQIRFSARSKVEHKAGPVISLSNGDVMSLDTMLRMAGRTLDDTWKDREGVEDVRARGVAVILTITYHNLERWTLFFPTNPPWYTIEIEAMKSYKFKHISVIDEEDNSRDIQMAYGVYFVVRQDGHLAFFDPIYALVAMSSALALVMAANKLTDFLMLYVLPLKHLYYKEKYHESRDFGELRKIQEGKKQKTAWY